MKCTDEYYIVTNKDNSIAAYKTVEDGLSTVEKMYNKKHYSNYEGSMSACINWMTFQPAIISFDSIETLAKALLTQEPRVFALSHVSGFMNGIRCDKAKAKKVWDRARKPELISEP